MKVKDLIYELSKFDHEKEVYAESRTGVIFCVRKAQTDILAEPCGPDFIVQKDEVVILKP